ncbi:ATP-binding protein [Filomicrobium insigne]|uniref:ATP-binding protein n=1 Tax=Filomicrobium insigne TaxID=418854 RepID=UPI000AA2C0CF|nr:ATP-binding protein [Filomicrobium insigne]
MSRTVYFTVSPRLTALLGENYRQTEAALKELVDNAWDADAGHVWVTLPQPMTSDPIIIRDDGHGMGPGEVETEYLDIARDRRSIKGKYTPNGDRRVKGRKGIGKFAGLAAARTMELVTVRDGICSQVSIDKDAILNAPENLEHIPLPMEERPAPAAESGTTITLRDLDQALNFPSAERLRALLLYEYGREPSITILVNGRALDVEDFAGGDHYQAGQA